MTADPLPFSVSTAIDQLGRRSQFNGSEPRRRSPGSSPAGWRSLSRARRTTALAKTTAGQTFRFGSNGSGLCTEMLNDCLWSRVRSLPAGCSRTRTRSSARASPVERSSAYLTGRPCSARGFGRRARKSRLPCRKTFRHPGFQTAMFPVRLAGSKQRQAGGLFPWGT